MSVASSVQLPAQPTVGRTIWTPLGGNGYTSPHSMYEVEVILTNDASGGDTVMDILFDPRWETLCCRVEAAITSSLANEDYQFELNKGAIGALPPKVPMREQGEFDNNAETFENWAMWDLPPNMAAQQVGLFCTNIDTEVTTFRAWLYNFHNDASRRVPISILLASIPRGSSSSSIASHG